MKKIALTTSGILLLFFAIGCTKKTDPFEIGKDYIGNLKATSKVSEVDLAFANDSVVKRIAGDEFIGTSNEINVYEKGGKHLLILEAKEEFDSTATVSSIQVIDPRFKTTKGLNINSTFKDIKDNYTISKISNTFSNVVIDIKEINAFVSISKKDLPSELRYDSEAKIEASQIPDTAKIKYFWLYW